jgi:Raf kinase inhibitor-like YbhB/YbcL family protein
MDAIHGVKSAMGHALRTFHAGGKKLASHDAELTSSTRLAVWSPAFEYNGEISQKHSADGANLSPPLRWSGVPAGTGELVLICEDPDAPKVMPFVHWVVYGLPPDLTSLPEGIPSMDPLASMPDLRQGKNSADQIGYSGPRPPVGHGVHHYHFQLFALDKPLKFNYQPGREDLIAAIAGHVLAVGDLIGTYERK